MKKIAVIVRSIAEKHPLLLFYTLILVMTVAYYYHVLLFAPPQSIHRWRQTDSASMTLNLYQHGMKFFHPEVHSLTSDDLTTGNAAAEAPVLYFVVALFYRLFGPHDFIFRMLNTLIFLIGLGALFKISRHFLHDMVLAAFVPLCVFVSPVVAYYGNNFLTDSTSLALVFMGWWQYIRYLGNRRYSLFLLALLLFTTAGLLKATMTLNLAALGGLAFIWHLRLFREKEGNLFPAPPATFLPMIAGLAVIAGWYAYAIAYNHDHHSSTFLLRAAPWWKLSSQQRQEITRHILRNNLTMYYSTGVLTLLLLATGLFFRYIRHTPKFLAVITVLLLAGGVLYINLYYIQFQYHDYYLMLLFSPVAFLLIASLVVVRSRFQRLFTSWYLKVFLLAFIGINVFHARQEMKLRYFGWKREYPVQEDYFTIRPYLRSIGILPGDRVISMPDYTNCYTLYLMNQPGNTLGDIGPKTKETLEDLIGKGARYLMINDPAFLSNPEIQPFIARKSGEYGQISIFRIDTLMVR